jgi:hypothetical protein
MARADMHRVVIRLLRAAHNDQLTDAGLPEIAVFAAMYAYPEAFR